MNNPVLLGAAIIVVLAVIFPGKTKLLLQGLHGFANEYNSSYVSDEEEEDKKD